MRPHKIGLLTLPIDSNYGGILQLKALQAYLTQQGYETVHLDLRYPEATGKRLIRRTIEALPGVDFKNIAFRKKIAAPLHRFTAKEIQNSTAPIYDAAQLTQLIEEQKIDTVIVGSDQIWRMDYLSGIWSAAFLDFVPDTIRKVSYAASFGKSKWVSDDRTNKIKDLLKRFDAISVREDSGQLICAEVFDRPDAVHVLDPTLLIEKDFYSQYLTPSSSEKGVFTYILDHKNYRTEVLNSIATRLGVGIYSINVGKPIAELKKEKGYQKPTMQEWLQGFHDAKFVVTDSFHGTIFSIIFNKPFITIANAKRGITRFTSLLKLLDLEDRLLYQDGTFDETMIERPIDYAKVNERIKGLRTRSADFLRTALQGK